MLVQKSTKVSKDRKYPGITLANDVTYTMYAALPIHLQSMVYQTFLKDYILSEKGTSLSVHRPFKQLRGNPLLHGDVIARRIRQGRRGRRRRGARGRRHSNHVGRHSGLGRFFLVIFRETTSPLHHIQYCKTVTTV